MSTNDREGATIAAKASHYLDVNSGAVVPEIQLSTTFARDDRYSLLNAANLYSRDDNPTHIHAERTLADLENGEECRLFASGMAAIASIFYSLTPGSHVVLPDAMYWGARLWIYDHCKRQDIFISEYDTADAATIEACVADKNRTNLVWVETPSNPMMHVTDIELAAEIAHAHDALVCVDSTAATPVFSQPLDHGADLVVHSATKYLNGHSDVLAGAVITRDEHPLWQALSTERKMAEWSVRQTIQCRLLNFCSNTRRLSQSATRGLQATRAMRLLLSKCTGVTVACCLLQSTVTLLRHSRWQGRCRLLPALRLSAVLRL